MVEAGRMTRGETATAPSTSASADTKALFTDLDVIIESAMMEIEKITNQPVRDTVGDERMWKVPASTMVPLVCRSLNDH